MKKVEKFVCDYCHTEYTDKAECDACEKNHKAVKQIVTARYLNKKMQGTGTPVAIVVEMSDGQKLTYKRG